MAVSMLQSLAVNWWLILLRGIAAVAFGLVALLYPGLTLIALAIAYAIYAIADGALAFGAAIANRATTASTWWLVIAGVLGIAAGLVMLLWPGMTAIALVLVSGAWAIGHGLVEIIGAIQLRKHIDNEWALILGGALSVMFGVLVWAYPGSGALALIWIIAGYAIAFGALLITFSFRLRAHRPAM